MTITALQIDKKILIPLNEIELTAVRSQGAGGQHVNKVATAIHLRFDINASTLPEIYKERLRLSNDRRITKDGIIIIKAQQYRSQIKNRDTALLRLRDIIERAVRTRKKRKATVPTLSSVHKRLENKKRRGKIKIFRKKVFKQE